MSDFYVDLGKLNRVTSEWSHMQTELSRIADGIRHVSSSGAISGLNRAAAVALNRQADSIGKLHAQVGAFSNAAREISALYRNCEAGLAGRRGQNMQIRNQSSDTAGEEIKGKANSAFIDELFQPDNLWELIGEIGVIGAIGAFLGQLLTGGQSISGLLKCLKSGAKLGEAAAEMVEHSAAGFDWKTLFGLEKEAAKGKPTGFWNAFKDETDKLRFSKAEGVAGKTKVSAKWAGHFLTLLLEGHENFQEGNSFVRSIEETLGETGVSILEGMLISAGLTAVVGASAPVAVGVATVAITMLIDAGWKHFTGEDLGESISDFFLDNIVEPAGNAISGWWNNISNGFRRAFSFAH